MVVPIRSGHPVQDGEVVDIRCAGEGIQTRLTRAWGVVRTEGPEVAAANRVLLLVDESYTEADRGPTPFHSAGG